MLLEGRLKGLILEFNVSSDGGAAIQNPINGVFPLDKKYGKGTDMCSYKVCDNILVHMQDLRQVHELDKYGTRYNIHLVQSRRARMLGKPRKPFIEGGVLEGYCSFGLFLHL